MVAVDSSSLIAYLSGGTGRDVDQVDLILEQRQLVLPPVVLSELLSDATLPNKLVKWIKDLPMLDISTGYWERAANLRAKILSKRLKARLADTLVAQTCIDYKVSLLTRDSDFRHFAKYSSLKLL